MPELNPDGTRRHRWHQRKVKKRRQSWKMGRDSPCQDCSKIVAHFPLDRAALWEVMDAGVGGGGKAPK